MEKIIVAAVVGVLATYGLRQLGVPPTVAKVGGAIIAKLVV
jgi:hypothetical protein